MPGCACMGMTGRALCYKLMFCRRRVQAVFMFSRMAPSHVIYAQSHTEYAKSCCFGLLRKGAVVDNCASHSVKGYTIAQWRAAGALVLASLVSAFTPGATAVASSSGVQSCCRKQLCVSLC